MKISPGNRDQRTSMHKDSNLHANFEQKKPEFSLVSQILDCIRLFYNWKHRPRKTVL